MDTVDIDQGNEASCRRLVVQMYSARAGGDDLIVCRVDTRACEVVNSGRSSLVIPKVG